MVDKQVKIKLGVDTDDSQVDSLERKIEDLERKSIHLNIDDSELDGLESEIGQLEADGIDLDVDDGKISDIKSKIDSVDDESIKPEVDNISALASIDQISQGFDRLKQGASEVGEQMGTILESAGKQETNKAFLNQALGAERAGQALNDINNVVQKLPGDDSVMQGLLGQAVAKDASMTTQELENMGTAAADYFQAMSFYGKSSTEAFQDMNNYLMTGNTAEIERSPILQNHIDKLKEGTTIQERSKLLQEALNEEHWGGMSQQDTYNNKLETFNGMLERGRYNLGGMFQEGAKGAMDFLLKLDESTNGLVGLGFAAAEFATPLFDMGAGLGQMAMGISAIKDLNFIQWLRDFELMTKLSAAADWLLAGAQAVLNAIMSMNPIILVVIALIALAAALIWAYQNVDWFREMVDGAWASLVQFGQYIYGVISGAIQWLGQLFQDFTNQLGLNTNNWIEAILGFILFIPQLPLQLGIALTNAIAETMGFGSNFVQRMISAGANAVSGFANYISQLPGIVMGEFNRVLGMVNDFINSIPSRVWDMGAAIIGALKSALGIGSPGHMFYMLEGEFERMEDLTDNTRFDTASIGQSMVDSFNPNLTGNIDGNNNGGVAVDRGTVINIYGDVDSEARVQQIIDVIRRELSWDNTKAGRTV